MTHSLTHTHRSPRRALVAAATALTAGLVLAVPGATSAAENAATTAEGAPALAHWTALENRALAPGVEHFRYRESAPNAIRAGAPRELNIIRMDPAKGALRLESTHGLRGGQEESVRTMLAKLPDLPIAGANGSYFANEGTPGVTPETIQTFGISARDGELTSANCTTSSSDPRQGVVLQYGIPYIAPLETVITVSGDKEAKESPYGEKTQRIDDVNRNPGGALACPRDADDQAGKVGPYTDAYGKSIAAYTDPTEFVLFDDTYEMPTPKRDVNKKITADDQAGYEVRLDATGRIVEGWAERGGHTVPEGEYILQAIGDHQADWLSRQHQAGAVLTIDQKVVDHSFDGGGVPRELPLDESVDIIAGGDRMVTAGTSHYGVDRPSEYAYGSCGRLYDVTGARKTLVTSADYVKTDFCRDTRTVLGVDDHGRTLIATLSGPRDTYAPDGGFLTEVAVPLMTLGAMDVVNLDGGGSTTLLTGAELTRQSGLTDGPAPGTERQVADALYIGRGGYPQR
ncbi:phosphodiester glycosidase family protein [Streptomyces sp. NPDC053755]|uniref:phosphodiester glycosidase family protein n=1 Tax=Streptomyces sp. NPDC053755 TaxID=3155815 RepID=UPI00344AB7BB